MTVAELDRAMRWVRQWRTKTKSNPSVQIAYAAGYRAAMREARKQDRPPRGSYLTDCDMHS